MMERRKLAPPYVYGPDIKLSEVRAGDAFSVERNDRRSARSGTITKVKKVNFDYDTVYAPRLDFEQVMHLTAPLCELIGGLVVRGETVHYIVEG